jgi:uncharacterized repeat protein (TIGR03803 family)
MRMRSLCIGLTLGALGLVAASAASATTWTENALHSFCASTGCSDGGSPGLPVLKSGNVLYSVTSGGGSHSGGIVYSYDTSTSTYTVLYNFCSTHVVGHATICSDGESPATKLIIDTSGNLYGTTQLGGNVANAGTVWELVKPVGAGSWTYKSIYKFCPDLVGSVGCADGDDPLTGLTYAGAQSGTAYDGSSLLFGATYVGGSDAENSYGNGVLYALQLSGTTWSQNAFYDFCPSCSESCTGCGDGVRPYGDIVLDANNKFWGTTIEGGRQGRGMTYELSPSSSNLWTASWTETVLFNFCWSGVSGCAEGQFPNGVIQDASGNLYGTASGGNSHAGGLLYKLASGSCLEFGGDGPYWCETVLHDFCTTSACNDGSGPQADLVMDSSGNIFGTTSAGGSHAIVAGGAGTVWKYNGTAESVLYKFCPTSSTCTDGEGPSAGVTPDSSGNFFGVTDMGGNSSNEGVIFELSPS